MFIEKYEIIKEFQFVMDELDFSIKARIVKMLDQEMPFPYSWDISHYCKQFEEAASAYIPGSNYGSTPEEVEHKLMTYVNKFTTWGIQENTIY